MTNNKEENQWEGEGGSAASPVLAVPGQMSGTPAQVEWADRIKTQVNDEFDRVAATFQAIADKQSNEKRANTLAILTILEEKRIEVMSRQQAAYFIREWQEISDQVRQLIFHDPRYEAIRARRSEKNDET